jgi:hypothetical protein
VSPDVGDEREAMEERRPHVAEAGKPVASLV